MREPIAGIDRQRDEVTSAIAKGVHPHRMPDIQIEHTLGETRTYAQGSSKPRRDQRAGRDQGRYIATVQTDIAAVRADMRQLRTELEAKIDLVRHQFTRLGGLMVVGFTLLFAALHFWQPHG